MRREQECVTHIIDSAPGRKYLEQSWPQRKNLIYGFMTAVVIHERAEHDVQSQELGCGQGLLLDFSERSCGMNLHI